MNRREDLQQFFISANSAQDNHDFDFEKFTDEYLIRHPVVKENCNLAVVSDSFCDRCKRITLNPTKASVHYCACCGDKNYR